MALSTSGGFTQRFLPPVLAGGINGSKICHWNIIFYLNTFQTVSKA
ncbi:hypothetical protein [Geminocystis sp. NIES-3709]|nr:hypothetical protein GM3709_3550 [Geminocystis sp. NIES-3709]